MTEYKCDDCQKPFAADTVIRKTDPADLGQHVSCGNSWHNVYYGEGVEFYREIMDHEPNGGYEYFCYKCKPDQRLKKGVA